MSILANWQKKTRLWRVDGRLGVSGIRFSSPAAPSRRKNRAAPPGSSLEFVGEGACDCHALGVAVGIPIVKAIPALSG
jgi:hypothetical protein